MCRREIERSIYYAGTMTILTCGLHDPKAGLQWIAEEHLAELFQIFDRVVITATPETDRAFLDWLEENGCDVFRRKKNVIAKTYFDAVTHGLETHATSILYCDADRAFHWVSKYPKELAKVANQLPKLNYFIGMRGPREYGTHHDALLYTEQLPNAIISQAMGEKKLRDYLSGCYGFSAKAASYIKKHMKANDLRFFGEWPLFMKKHGFKANYMVCKGLDWETPDQHQDDVKRSGSVKAYREQLSTSKEWKKRALMAMECVKTIVLKP